MLSNLFKFVHYWYLRYLMTTELYMVEKWERHVAHVILFIIFSILSYINMKLILSCTGLVMGWALHTEMQSIPVTG